MSNWKHAQEANDDTFEAGGVTFNTWSKVTEKYDGDLQEALGVMWAQGNKSDEGLKVLKDTYEYSHGKYDINASGFKAGDLKKEFKGAKNEAARLKVDPKRDRYKSNAKRPKSK